MKGVNKGQFKNPMPHYEVYQIPKRTFMPATPVSAPKTKVW